MSPVILVPSDSVVLSSLRASVRCPLTPEAAAMRWVTPAALSIEEAVETAHVLGYLPGLGSQIWREE